MPKQIIPHRIDTAIIPAVAERRVYHVDFGDTPPADVAYFIEVIKESFQSAVVNEVPPTEIVLTEDQALHNVETAVARAQAVGAIPEALQPIVDAVPINPAHKEELHEALFPSTSQTDDVPLEAVDARAAWPFPGVNGTTATDLPAGVEDSFAPQGGEVSVKFQNDLKDLINSHSIENSLGMPDFVIAELMCKHLNATVAAVWRTAQWNT